MARIAAVGRESAVHPYRYRRFLPVRRGVRGQCPAGHGRRQHAGGELIERYPQAVRVGTILNGVMFFACAYGIYRRYLFAWWAGFAVLLLGQAYFVVDLYCALLTIRQPS